MGKLYIASNGSGVYSSEVTAKKSDVRKGVKTITSDSGNEIVEGLLNVSDTSDATITAKYLLKGIVAYGKNNERIVGEMEVQSAVNFNIAVISYNSVKISWTQPSVGPYSGVKIYTSTSTILGNDGILSFQGQGTYDSESNTYYAIVANLSENTQYYFWVYSYCTGLSDSTVITNLSAKTAIKTLTMDIFLDYLNGSDASMSYREAGTEYGFDSFYSNSNLSEEDRVKSAVFQHNSGSNYLSILKDKDHPMVIGYPYSSVTTSVSYTYQPKLNLRNSEMFIQLDRWRPKNAASRLTNSDISLLSSNIRNLLPKYGLRFISASGSVIKDFGAIKSVRSGIITMEGLNYYKEFKVCGIAFTVSSPYASDGNPIPSKIEFYAL